MAKCRSCEAEIIWATMTASGKHNPLDAKPTKDGTIVLLPGGARMATDEDRKLHRDLYTSHFATCPDAGNFRRPR